MIKTPSFFYRKSLFLFLLLPFSFIFASIVIVVYYCGFKRKSLKKPKVICLGNFIAGGSGKTPACISIADGLKKMGYKCCFLTIGYGRKNKRKHFIKEGNPANLTADITGDEPLLLANICDVFVVNKRYDVPDLIEEYDYVICDDDLWDKSLKYDIKIAILSQRYGFGNEFILPAGPMRTFSWLAKIFSDFVFIVEDNSSFVPTKKVKKYIEYFANKNKLVSAKLVATSDADKNKKYLAFSGLANNEKFFLTAKDLGYNILQYKTFADHYVYTKNDINNLKTMALKYDLILMTTEKDFVKIKDLIGNFPIEIIKIKINISKDNLIKIING
jgi:tetraacyldisaccharide 4'-kinase